MRIVVILEGLLRFEGIGREDGAEGIIGLCDINRDVLVVE